MNRLWEHVLLDLVRAAGARVLCEIGTQHGALAEKILEYCREAGAVLHVIDPEPQLDLEEWRERHGDRLIFHRGYSLDVLPVLESVDFVFVDGDHNWYTVVNELRILERNADAGGEPPPVVALHDVGWPYGRRDLYYDPATIPEAHRHPSTQGALHPDTRGIVERGLNAHLHNALEEGTEANGVLTAVEDFMHGSARDWTLLTLPALHGLGLLVDAARLELRPRLAPALARLESAEFLREHADLIEHHRVLAEIRATEARRLQASRSAPDEDAERLQERADAALEHTRRETAHVRAVLADVQGELQAIGLAGARADAERDRADAVAAEHAERTAALEDELRSAGERAAQNERERVETALELARTSGELGVVEARLEAVSRRFDDATAEHGALGERIERLERERGELELRHRESIVQAARAEAERDALASRVEEFRQERGAARAELERSQAAAGELSELVARLEDRLTELQDAGERARGSERETRTRLVAQVDALEERLERARNEKAELASELAEALRPPSTPAESPAEQAVGEELDAARSRLAAMQSVLDRLDEEPAPVPSRARATAQPARVPDDAPRREPDAPDPERDARVAFSARYAELCGAAGLGDLSDDGIAHPWPVFTEPDGDLWTPSVSIVVCVHNALEDVRRCLASIAAHLTMDAEVVVVNDGSDEPTTSFLRRVAQTNTRVRLITNDEPPHGYTIAANLGMRRAQGEYIVLLNSDTIVSAGWLERIVAAGEESDRVGLLGPLSNAATHQSVPAVRHAGAWATNPLPEWLTADGASVAVSSVSELERPRVPFINGFCYVVKRKVLDDVGFFDEENFASGYCEENDFSLRAHDAGYEAAVVDDAWVFHAKSRSYTPEGRNEHAKRNYSIFLAKHGVDRVNGLVDELERQAPAAGIGARLDRALAEPRSFVASVHERLGEEVSPVFVLPGVAKGGSGGSHSIVQEVTAMRELGIPARVAVPTSARGRIEEAYPDDLDLFVPYLDVRELEEATGGANVVIATHFKSVELVQQLRSRRTDFLTAYYIQDYEPFFADPDTPGAREAHDSYTAIPGSLLFAKTHWLCNIVAASHRVRVLKVEPSLDTAIYRHGRAREWRERPLVVAMVRPRTPRRQPRATLRLLERLNREFDGEVDVASFGCGQADVDALIGDPMIRSSHRGMLSRQEVAALLQEATMFVDLSTYQAFGRTALEAMACGCVPVVPTTGGVWEFAEPGANAVVTDTHDEQRAYTDTAAVLRDPEQLARMREGGVSTAARYSRERAALSEFALFSGALLRARMPATTIRRSG